MIRVLMNNVTLTATNNKDHYDHISSKVRQWVETYYNESECEVEIAKIVKQICLNLFRMTGEEIYKIYSSDNSILMDYARALKNHFVDVLYRQTANMSKVHHARFVEIADSTRTIAIYRSKTINPHIAIVLRKSSDSSELVCHLANLEYGDFGNGVYGSEAKTAFLSRITSYIG